MIEYKIGRGTTAALSFSAAFRKARGGGSHELPAVGQTTNVTNVGQGKFASFTLDGTSSRCVAFGLLTCAGVIMLSQDAPTDVVVYHAPSGSVTGNALATMCRMLNNPAQDSLRAIYATPQPWDSNYQGDAQGIEDFIGVADTVCYFQNFGAVTFGINAIGFVGI
ncbi:MAG: hypothetical protein OHK0024_05920 [Thalassobaculales bacterium]